MLSSPDISSLTAAEQGEFKVVEHDAITGGDIDFMAGDILDVAGDILDCVLNGVAGDNLPAKGDDCGLSAAKDVDGCSLEKEAVFKSSTVSLKSLMMLGKSTHSNNQRLVFNDFIWANRFM